MGGKDKLNTGMLVSPAERWAPITALGLTSSLPERFGVDVLWSAPLHGLCGVQRKAFPADFLASKSDGRLQREAGQSSRLGLRLLVIEGRPRWSSEGELILINHGPHWTRSQMDRYLFSAQAKGFWISWSDDPTGTAAVVRDLYAWSMKASHHSLDGRPAMPRDAWGTVDNADYACYVLSSLPDVGVTLANRILEHFGGPPFGWSITQDQLQEVHGIGKVKAARIYRALTGGAS